MSKVDPAELVSGLIIVAVGAFFFFASYEYRMGTIARMGPGFVPHWLGAVGMLLGLIVVASSLGGLSRGDGFPTVAWRPVLAVLGAILAFAVLLRPIGLVPTLFATTILSMLANPKATPLQMLVTATVVAAICWAIFIEILGLPMRPFWFGR